MMARDVRALRAQGPARRTYLCLEGLSHKPSDYEITSTALLYHPERGFEVRTPILEQPPSKLSAPSWDAFVDPAQLTYASYVAERRDQEAFLDRLQERQPRSVPPGLRPLFGLLSALRFPLHALQMLAAYVGSQVPSGRIAIAAAFQAADELRRVQRLCSWLSRSGETAAELDRLGREIWQESRDFQPLRRCLEELLVCCDWAEVLVALNGVIKPVFDRLWFEQLAAVAERQGDELLEKTLISLGDDGRWHEQWFQAFARLAAESHADNACLLSRFAARQRPVVAEAAQALLRAFDPLFGDEGGRAYVFRELDGALGAHLTAAGIAIGGEHERRR
jgi:toluene monooxygenase system protein E